jgi:hypothetical protein
MFGTAYEILRQQRLACASVMIVALFLIFIVHAPILPVAIGCALALGIAILRAFFRRTRNVLAPRGR